MSPAIIALIAGVVGIVVIQKLFSPSVDREVARASAADDVTSLLNVLANLKSSAQPDAFNKAIRRLWDDYKRELAAVLIRELGERHANERIAQYWLDQIQKVEPELAREMLEPAFVERYYRPDVAARCGSFG